jgi:hypothetical protein
MKLLRYEAECAIISAMTDPATVGAAVGMLNAALSAFKHVRELSSDSGDLNLKESVAELYEKLLDLKQKLIELEDENRQLRQQLEAKAELERRPPFGYWYKKDENDPLCRVCYERDGKLIYLDAAYHGESGVSRFCRACKDNFTE